MKKIDFRTVSSLLALMISLAAAAMIWCRTGQKESSPAAAGSCTPPADRESSGCQVIRAQGYLRAGSMTTYKNKYAGFVSKVHVFSGRKVKKGQVILEYDDHPWRSEVEAKRNKIAELEKKLLIAKNDQEITKLNPLPSDFRNLTWKMSSAKEQLAHARNELEVYRRLFRSKAVSDLDLRNKQQLYTDALSEYESRVSDRKKVLKGMASFYIAGAACNVALLETQLAAAKRELELLIEEGKYYKITASRDGICETNSDTVASYNAAGTAAASVHAGDKRRVYAYFEEKYLPFLTEGETARYRSNQTGEYLELKMFEVDRNRKVYGNKSYYTVKFNVTSPAAHLRLESNGVVEYPVRKQQ